METTTASIEKALKIVQKTLDSLTSRGHDAAAFELARAQYSASLRSSWPANLSPMVGLLERLRDDPEISLTGEERAEVRTAASLLRDALE